MRKKTSARAGAKQRTLPRLTDEETRVLYELMFKEVAGLGWSSPRFPGEVLALVKLHEIGVAERRPARGVEGGKYTEYEYRLNHDAKLPRRREAARKVKHGRS